MKIVFDAGSGGPNYPWADCSLNDGIGGSEECLIRLAREFGALGHETIVYNNCQVWADRYAASDVGGIVEYRHFEDSRRLEHADILISQRNWLLLENREASVRVLSCHDVPVGCHLPCADECFRRHNPALNHIDKIVYLNPYHRSLSPWIPEDRAVVIPIGVDQTAYTDEYSSYHKVSRNRARVLYFSHPNRGLDQLRAVWPRVHGAVPQATLASFWWEPDHFRREEPQYGILPMSRLNAYEAQVETLKAGVFGYPCIFSAEISPQTTILAQCGGCFPCVVSQGGMVDTVQFGVKTDHGNFADVLIDILRQSINGDLEDERMLMQEWALHKYSWAKVAQQWLDALSPR